MSDFEHVIFPWVFNLRFGPHLKHRLNDHMTTVDEILDELNEVYADRADCAVLVDAANHSERIRVLIDRLIHNEAALRDGIDRTLRMQEANQRKTLRMRVRKRIEDEDYAEKPKPKPKPTVDVDDLPVTDPRFLGSTPLTPQ